MLAADNWHVPTFNYQLRVDKPALLYWLQIMATLGVGVGEFAVGCRRRWPRFWRCWPPMSWDGERWRRCRLIGGIALATAVVFSAAAHFANPDALLCACTVLTFCCSGAV